MQKAIITMNGVEQEVPSFMPELTGQLAIVHLSVLQRLAALLPNASINTIKQRICSDIMSCGNIDELVSVLENELAFQTSVNQIRLYKPEEDIVGLDDICQ